MQKLVNNMVTIEDREQRTRYAHILVELMRQIHPNMKDGQDYYNKLWDDLYIMSGFTLDVDSPYPPPSPEALGRPPQRVPYNTHRLRFKHFGRNVELMVKKASVMADADERRAFVSYLVRLMKTFYSAWNKEAVEDETIFQSLLELSNGDLSNDIQLIRDQGMVEGTPRERTDDQPQRAGYQPNYQSRDNSRPNRHDGQRNNPRNDGGRNSFRGNNQNNQNRGNNNQNRNNNNNNQNRNNNDNRGRRR